MSEIVLHTRLNQVSTVTMNNPPKLNGWNAKMGAAMREVFQEVAKDDYSKVMILTGADPYYSAGGSFAPQELIVFLWSKMGSLKASIAADNLALFDNFLSFPKPILVTVNGPAIGGPVTSLCLCDHVICSDLATFHTPFKRLGLHPEGCSTVLFPALMGKDGANKLLYQGCKINSQEAKEMGLVQEVVKHENLMARAQEEAELWIRDGRTRNIPGGISLQRLNQVNQIESKEVAESIFSEQFYRTQEEFLRKRGKKAANIFWMVRKTRPLWSKLMR